MRSKWIQHKGERILYQDFSNLFFQVAAVKQELVEVVSLVVNEPLNSVLVLSDFRDTQITSELMPIMNDSSKKTKDHVRKTAVLGVTGMKRTLGDLLSRITGQQLMYFDDEAAAKDWLTTV
ncbi:MAG: hypothetical protein AB1649_15320 [Chloroflexota bacterium]